MKKVISIFLFALCCFITHGQQSDRLQLVEQKLPSCFNDVSNYGSIKDIYQDSKGFIWISSSQGFARYDGYEFKYFKHDKNNPHSIANSITCYTLEDSKGNLWFGLISGGISCYNPLTNSFKNYNTKSILSSSNDPIMALYIDQKDEVWFSIGYKGLSHLNKENGTFETWDIVTAERCPNTKPHKVPLHNFLMDIVDRDENNLWLGTPEGLFSFNKTTKEITVMRPKLSKDLHHDVYNAKFIFPEGCKVWIGGWGSSIQCYDTLSKTWADYTFNQANKNYTIYNSMVRKDDDEFWLASPEKGLATFNTTSCTFTFLQSDSTYNNLPNETNYLVFSDKQKNLYVVYYYDVYFFKQKPNLFREYKIPTYASINSGVESVHCVYEEKSKRYLYAGTYNSAGIIRCDRITNEVKPLQLKLNNKEVFQPYVLKLLERDSASLWMLTPDKLYIYYYNSNRLTVPPQPPLLNQLRGTNGYVTMAIEGDKFLWIGTSYNGIIKYDVETGNTQCYAKDEKDTAQIGSIYIQCIAVDKKNNLWYGSTRGSLLARFDATIGKSIYYDKNGNSCNESNSIQTYGIYSSGNDVYASTNKGLLIFDISGKEFRLKRKIDSDNGFASDYIGIGGKENDSLLWINTTNGIILYNLNSNLYDIFNRDDGLKNYANSIFSSNAGTLFVSAMNTFYEYLPNVKQNKTKALAPVLTSFKINEDDINFNASLKNENKITIEPAYSFFTVSFASLDYSNAPEIKYSYMLEGFSKNWIDAGDRRYATFSNLSGGSYILKLRATLDNGANFSRVTSIPIYIETIYYKSWWFRLITALTLSFVLFSIYKYRIKQKQAIDELNSRAQLLEKEKSVVQYENLKQQLNPHFLFNSLTSLSSLITVDPKIARQFVDQMSKIYRYILKSSENETVPLINEINFATTYVKLQQTRFDKGFEVNFNVGEEFNHRKIVPVTIQNLIENAIKHNIIDEESPLVIDIFIEDDFLVVKNNLQRKGIVESSNKMGLEKMKTLYKYLSDRPIIIKEANEKFEIKIPLI